MMQLAMVLSMNDQQSVENILANIEPENLLQLLCGSKEQYRKFKDHHLLMTSVKQLINN